VAGNCGNLLKVEEEGQWRFPAELDQVIALLARGRMQIIEILYFSSNAVGDFLQSAATKNKP
jgi:hypothetical protein